MSIYPDPAAVEDPGAPMYTFTFGLGLVVRAQLSLTWVSDGIYKEIQCRLP